MDNQKSNRNSTRKNKGIIAIFFHKLQVIVINCSLASLRQCSQIPSGHDSLQKVYFHNSKKKKLSELSNFFVKKIIKKKKSGMALT